jgi:pilus assembly protein CpaB
MPAPRKPKKVFVQFAVALVIAGIVGVIAIVLGFNVITGVSKNAEKARKEAEKIKAEAEADKERIRRELEKAREAPVIKVTYKTVQATQQIAPGQPITQEMVSLVESEDRPLPGSLNQLSQAIGKLVKMPVQAGETLDQSKLLDSSGLILVQPGKRAITIQVDNIAGLGGGLSPGERVDILTTVTKDDETITRTLMQSIPIISVGDNGTPSAAASSPLNTSLAYARNVGHPSGSNGGSAVTLEVTPKQAELLTLANQTASFHLTLRNFNDKAPVKVVGADMTELMTGLSSAALNKSLPKKPQSPGNGDGFQNVNFSPNGDKLPEPSPVGPAASKFSMQILTGTGEKTVEFER